MPEIDNPKSQSVTDAINLLKKYPIHAIDSQSIALGNNSIPLGGVHPLQAVSIGLSTYVPRQGERELRVSNTGVYITSNTGAIVLSNQSVTSTDFPPPSTGSGPELAYKGQFKLDRIRVSINATNYELPGLSYSDSGSEVNAYVIPLNDVVAHQGNQGSATTEYEEFNGKLINILNGLGFETDNNRLDAILTSDYYEDDKDGVLIVTATNNTDTLSLVRRGNELFLATTELNFNIDV